MGDRTDLPHAASPVVPEIAAVPSIRVLEFGPVSPAAGAHERLSFWHRIRSEHGRRRALNGSARGIHHGTRGA